VQNLEVEATATGMAIAVGIDVFHNAESYSRDDIERYFSPADNVNPDDNTGYVFHIGFG